MSMQQSIASAIRPSNSNCQFTDCYAVLNLQIMDKNSMRLEKLRALVEMHGGIAEFARSTKPGADKPIDTTYVSQVLNGHRSFGEKAALNMARRAGLPDNYFDTETNSTPREISELMRTVETLAESGKMSLEEIRKMTELLKARN